MSVKTISPAPKARKGRAAGSESDRQSTAPCPMAREAAISRRKSLSYGECRIRLAKRQRLSPFAPGSVLGTAGALNAELVPPAKGSYRMYKATSSLLLVAGFAFGLSTVALGATNPMPELRHFSHTQQPKKHFIDAKYSKRYKSASHRQFLSMHPGGASKTKVRGWSRPHTLSKPNSRN